ncbi:AbrB/MazE/SpoVT family DNA-binding domain-containing protein [Pseudoxanthobacter sp. M-2]|uniref:AbrB/MazE/SpoVT family DNA-binding domain-containing protein n=1 Tax=Pseudoxanthobacter sp. M-2 TaxID=3078754 RepID=UPI0038FD346E
MLTSTLRTVGGSVMMTIPKAILEGLGLAANEKVALHIEHGKLVVEPRPRPRYALADLIAQCDPTAPEDSEQRDWDKAQPVGREVL